MDLAPTTRSTNGKRSSRYSFVRSAAHPVTTTLRPGRLAFQRLSLPISENARSSACCRTVQVLTRMTDASSWSGVSTRPRALKWRDISFESATFIWHPYVRTKNFITADYTVSNARGSDRRLHRPAHLPTQRDPDRR